MTDVDPRPRTLRDDLDLLANAAPRFGNPPEVRHTRRPTWTRSGVLAGAVAALVLATAGTAAVIDLWRADPPSVTDAPSLPESAPATVPESQAYEYSAGCNADREASGYCPIDEQGRRAWDELVAAFDGYLTPISLAQIPRSELGPGVPEHAHAYVFEAWIGSPDEQGHRYRLMASTVRPQDPLNEAPSADPHPAFPEDFRFGQGVVDITQADGTQIRLRFWATTDDTTSSEGSLDVPALFRAAADRLAG